MTDTQLAPELLDSLKSSAREVLETMVFLQPVSIESVDQQGTARPSVFTGEVIGSLGFTGTKSGSVVIACSRELCRTMAAKMLMMEPDELSDFAEVADGFGEIVNMITGSFKNTWVAMGNEMHLSVPTVTQHGEVSFNGSHPGIICSVRIELGCGPLDVTVLFAGEE